MSSAAPGAAPDSTAEPDRSGWDQFHFQSGASALLGAGVLPTVALGPGFNIGIRHHYIAVLLEGRFFHTPDFSIPSGQTSARLYMGAVRVCWNVIPPIRFLEYCGLAGGGLIDMGYMGVEDRVSGIERAHPFTFTAGASLGAEFDLDKVFHLKGFAELGVPIVGTKVSYDAGAHWDILPARLHGIFGIEMSIYSKFHDPVTGH